MKVKRKTVNLAPFSLKFAQKSDLKSANSKLRLKDKKMV